MPGNQLPGVFTLKTMSHGDAILKYVDARKPRAACVVGAGPIGIEAADSLRSLGIEVYLVEKEKTIAARLFNRKMSGKIQQLLEARKLNVMAGTELIEISGTDRVQAVHLSDGSKLDCEMVLLAIGMRPNIEIATKSGMEAGKRGGIPVDAGMRTRIDDVYACGDCCEIFDPFMGDNRICALWPNAVLGGKTAGLNCLGVSRPMPPPMEFNRINIHDLDAVSLGYSEETLNKIPNINMDVIEGSAHGADYSLILADGRLVGAQILGNNPMPMILSLIYKKEKLAYLKNTGSISQFSLLNPLSYSLAWRWPNF
jgi:NADPH-dependent 2,4-dienoyl-CoA reductase/sulfur reductase-like enzyme